MNNAYVVIKILFLLAILTIPYDSLPFFYYSIYSPSNIVFIVPAFILLIFTRLKVSKPGKYILVFTFVSFFHSLVSGLINNDLHTSIKHIVTLVVMISSFFVAEYSFSIKENYKVYTRTFMWAFALSLLTGSLQLLNQFGLNISFIRWFTSLFVTRLYEVRMQMLSGEPSWAVLHLLVLIPFLVWSNYASKLKNFIIIIAVLLFFLSFSSYGYAVVLLSLIMYILINFNMKSIFKYILLTISLLALIEGIDVLIQLMGINSYYSHRFDISFYFNNNVLEEDGSMFVRVVFPYIGILEFLEFPLGCGGGFYYVNAGKYLVEFFDYGLKYYEVLNYYINNTMQPICLYAKLLAEEGILSLFLFYSFYLVLKRCINKREKYIWCLAIALNFNFASYACVDFWILLGALSGGFFREENIGEENI